jgi:phosphate/sulfate permease
MEATLGLVLKYQLLISLVLSPIISLIIAAVAAWYSAKRAIASERFGRMHQSALEIAKYRQAWIDGLRDDLAEFAGVTSIARVGVLPADKAERVAVLSMRIRMRMNRVDQDYQDLVSTLANDTERFFLGTKEQQVSTKPLVYVAQQILKREWERLKSDLRGADQ